MIDFIDFARERGIVIDALPPIGVWKRYKTEDKPKSDNGACKYMGDHGFAQNHATMTTVDVWQRDKDAPPMTPLDHAAIARQVEAASRDRAAKAEQAARKAAWILAQCELTRHAYLERKGFPEEQGNVFPHRDGRNLLCIPMRIGDKIVGLQTIDEEGVKKFLFGQRTNGATFTMDNKGPRLLCEGYATALSVRAAAQALKARYTAVVCFSAFNLSVMSKALVASNTPHAVIADNDLSGTGELYPKSAGLPYWISDRVGEDFNDYARRVGEFKSSQALRKLLATVSKGTA